MDLRAIPSERAALDYVSVDAIIRLRVEGGEGAPSRVLLTLSTGEEIMVGNYTDHQAALAACQHLVTTLSYGGRDR